MGAGCWLLKLIQRHVDVITQGEHVERKRVNENAPAFGGGWGGGANDGTWGGLARRYQKAERKDHRGFQKREKQRHTVQTRVGRSGFVSAAGRVVSVEAR